MNRIHADEVMKMKKALLDTNIVIHREANRILDRDIGSLFRWLDKTKYSKCVHPVTIAEVERNSNVATADLFGVKLDSYEQLTQVAPLAPQVRAIADQIDVTENDRNDTVLLNEVFCDRVDVLITEDRKIHRKAQKLDISDRVFTIDSFLEKAVSENPDFIDYRVLSVTRRRFGEISLEDKFFTSLKEDYPRFEKWFNRKAEETAYITLFSGNLLSFLYLKVEGPDEAYFDIEPPFTPKRRLKIGTFKVVANGLRLGERFLKIIFDNAVKQHVDEIYVTIFNKREEQIRLIRLLEQWGFVRHGVKRGDCEDEQVYVRSMARVYNVENPHLSFPYISRASDVYLVPIREEYHTELLPDSILRTESPVEFAEGNPHRNAISKVYITRSVERGVKRGDLLVFYRLGGYYKSVVTTIGIVDSVVTDIKDESDFVSKCRKRSVFPDEALREHWNYKPHNHPFVINFLYAYSFERRMNMQQLIAAKVIADVRSAPRGLTRITHEQFSAILKGTHFNESFIVD